LICNFGWQPKNRVVGLLGKGQTFLKSPKGDLFVSDPELNLGTIL
jgi:hypothetical protein